MIADSETHMAVNIPRRGGQIRVIRQGIRDTKVGTAEGGKATRNDGARQVELYYSTTGQALCSELC